jgi:hypothetical protein
MTSIGLYLINMCLYETSIITLTRFIEILTKRKRLSISDDSVQGSGHGIPPYFMYTKFRELFPLPSAGDWLLLYRHFLCCFSF